jgi:hypothetical protein
MVRDMFHGVCRGVHEMAHDRLSTGMLFYLLRQHAIRAGRALVLTQMFGPGIHEKRLQVAAWIFEISKNSPLVCAVTVSETTEKG